MDKVEGEGLKVFDLVVLVLVVLLLTADEGLCCGGGVAPPSFAADVEVLKIEELSNEVLREEIVGVLL